MMEKPEIEMIVRDYLTPVYNFIYKLTGGQEESADLTQEVFIKVWKNLWRYDSEKEFRPWLFRIARNIFLDWYRKKRLPILAEPEALADDAPLPEARWDDWEKRQVLEKGLATLPPAYRATLILHHDEALTFAQIAEATGEPLNTVKSRYRRALHQMRVALRRLGYED